MRKANWPTGFTSIVQVQGARLPSQRISLWLVVVVRYRKHAYLATRCLSHLRIAQQQSPASTSRLYCAPCHILHSTMLFLAVLVMDARSGVRPARLLLVLVCPIERCFHKRPPCWSRFQEHGRSIEQVSESHSNCMRSCAAFLVLASNILRRSRVPA